MFEICFLNYNLVPRACDPREGTRGSGIIRCRKPGIMAKIELRIPFQRPIRFLPETDYPRASRSFPRIAGSGNEIALISEILTENTLSIITSQLHCFQLRTTLSGKDFKFLSHILLQHMREKELFILTNKCVNKL